MLGDRLLIPPAKWSNSSYHWCSKNATGDIYARYCTDNGTSHCDDFFTDNEVRYIPGIPGMASGVIKGKIKVYSWRIKNHFVYGGCNHGSRHVAGNYGTVSYLVQATGGRKCVRGSEEQPLSWRIMIQLCSDNSITIARDLHNFI